MDKGRLPKRLLYGEPQKGMTSAGDQWKRCKDTLKVSLNIFDIDADIWKELAGDRPSWRSLIAKRAVSYEESCLTRAENKRRQRKMFSVSSSSTQHHVCADCGRTFCTAIGLFSHKRTQRGSDNLTNKKST